MPNDKPLSPKRRVANRLNAQKSTGPRSSEGKARSSQNARKSSFDPAKYAVVRIEDTQLVANLRADAVATFRPIAPEECLAVDRIALANLSILRLSALEAGLFTNCLEEAMQGPAKPYVLENPDVTHDLEITTQQSRAYWTGQGVRRLHRQSDIIPVFLRYQAQAERLHRRAVEYFERLKTLRSDLPYHPPYEPPVPPLMGIQTLPNEPKNEPIPDPQPTENTPPATAAGENSPPQPSNAPRGENGPGIVNRQHRSRKPDADRARPRRVEHPVAQMVQRPAHRPRPGEQQLPAAHRDLDPIRRTVAEDIGARQRSHIVPGERDGGSGAGVPQLLQISQHRLRFRPTRFGMRQQADTVRPSDPLCSRLRRDKGLHHLQLPQHRRREECRPRPMADQILGDLAVSHVRSRTQCVLPVPKSPVPRSLGERWPILHQLPHPPEVPMSHRNHLANQIGRLCRKHRGDHRLPGRSRHRNGHPQTCETKPTAPRQTIRHSPASRPAPVAPFRNRAATCYRAATVRERSLQRIPFPCHFHAGILPAPSKKAA